MEKSLTLSLSQTLTHSHSLTHSLTLSLSLTLSHTHYLSHTLKLSLSHTPADVRDDGAIRGAVEEVAIVHHHARREPARQEPQVASLRDSQPDHHPRGEPARRPTTR